MKKKLVIVIGITVLLLISSCSVVFRGGVGGLIKDNNNQGIDGVRVWAYLDESARDSDYTTYLSDPTEVEQSSMIKGSTTTDANGNFTISALIWNSTSPVFGKTADVKEIYFLFYHELYGLQKNHFAVRIYSDATNSSAVNESFSKIKERSTVTIRIEDVANKSLLNEIVEATVNVTSNGEEIISTITGTGSVEITKEIDATAVIAIALLKELSPWTQCDVDGNSIALSPLSFSSTSVTTTLYMKSSNLTIPTLNGTLRITPDVIVDSHSGDEEDDDKILLLCDIDSSGKLIPFNTSSSRVVTAPEGTGANGEIIYHGKFSLLGANIEFTDTSYSGTYATKPLAIVVDENDNGEPDLDEKFYEITIKSNESTRNVGILSSPTTIDATHL